MPARPDVDNSNAKVDSFMRNLARATLLVLAALAIGCTASPQVSDVVQIYSRAAQEHDDSRNPVIVIPGILGSRLVAGDKVVWGAFGGGAADPGDPEDARLFALPLVRRDSDRVQDQSDEVVPDGALDRVKISLFGLRVEQRAYLNILGTLGAGKYQDEFLGEIGAIDYGDDHYTCFQFDYDWRRDIPTNARRLARFIRDARATVREHRPHGPIKFDLVAHSMGGLLARYYLRYGGRELSDSGPLPHVSWAGVADVERLIMIGTPNGGSAKALLQLTEGYHPNFFLPSYDPVLLGSFPSVYQLLPRARHRALHVDGQPSDHLLDPEFWIEQQWGLANPDYDDTLRTLLPEVDDRAERRQIAHRQLRQSLARAKRFHRAMDQPAQTPDELDIFLFVGDAIDTAAVVAPDGRGQVEVIDTAPGDGTVLRTSALLDERMDGNWTRRLRTPIDFEQVHILFSGHVELTSDPAFSDNVLFLLLEDPRG